MKIRKVTVYEDSASTVGSSLTLLYFINGGVIRMRNSLPQKKIRSWVLILTFKFRVKVQFKQSY